MRIEKNISLKPYNTFRVDVKADVVITIEDSSELLSDEISQYLTKENILFLGRGSNTLFSKDFKGTIFLLRNEGIEMLDESDTNILVKVNAGHQWNDFVMWSTEKGLIGLQNLIDIPGNVGSSPIQNIGAYGVEVKDYIESVKVLMLKEKEERVLSNKQCKFGYRDSIFKNELKGKCVITEVIFNLPKFTGKIEEKYLQYNDLKERVKEHTLENLLNTVRDIRKEKLPSIDEYGSCGSIFKNLQVDIKKYKELEESFPGLPSFKTEDKNIVKVPTAYILDKLGWKNKRNGDVGTWIYHPLIVTNYGNACASDIVAFIGKIQQDFKKNTGLYLETEINIF